MTEIPEHARIRLLGVREDFLKSLRGRSDVYDAIRAQAQDWCNAVGKCPAEAVHCLEAVLILQWREHQRELERECQESAKSAVRGERAALRLAIAKVLGA